MKQLVIGLLFCGFVMSAVPAQANVGDEVKGAAVWIWNLIPATLTFVNKGIHFTYDVVHTGIHKTAELLTIDVGE